jgi:hypothetical protein
VNFFRLYDEVHCFGFLFGVSGLDDLFFDWCLGGGGGRGGSGADGVVGGGGAGGG